MSKSGFTLIEVLLAMSIALILISTYSGLSQMAKLQINKVNQLRQEALILSNKMEQFQSKTFAEVLAEDNRNFAAGKGKISVLPLSLDLLSINLTLGSEELCSLRSKYD